MMNDLSSRISGVTRFVQNDIWRIRIRDLTGARRFLIKNTRILAIAVREFIEDKCPLRASGLTFYSLLSIVPVVAMAFAIAKGFGFQQRFEQQLLEKFGGQEQVILRVIEFSRSMLENTRGGLIAGVGVVILLWAVINVLGQIEDSLNHIWGIRKARSLGRKFSDYLSLMLIAPVLLIMSSSATVMIATQLNRILRHIELLGIVSPVIGLVIGILPYCLIWVLFAFIYIFIPNTKINYTSGIIAGVIAGSTFVIVQKFYIIFQVGVAHYNAIYGSFAALPLFLAWMQVSWLIVLFGAELSFAHENVEAYDFEPDRKKISPAFRKLASLQVAHLLVKHFAAGERPMTGQQISEALDMPIRLADEIVHDLVQCGLVIGTTSNEGKECAYQPARDINEFSISFILQSLENRGTDSIPLARTDASSALSAALREFGTVIEQSPANRLLKDI